MTQGAPDGLDRVQGALLLGLLRRGRPCRHRRKLWMRIEAPSSAAAPCVPCMFDSSTSILRPQDLHTQLLSQGNWKQSYSSMKSSSVISPVATAASASRSLPCLAAAPSGVSPSASSACRVEEMVVQSGVGTFESTWHCGMGMPGRACPQQGCLHGPPNKHMQAHIAQPTAAYSWLVTTQTLCCAHCPPPHPRPCPPARWRRAGAPQSPPAAAASPCLGCGRRSLLWHPTAAG